MGSFPFVSTVVTKGFLARFAFDFGALFTISWDNYGISAIREWAKYDAGHSIQTILKLKSVPLFEHVGVFIDQPLYCAPTKTPVTSLGRWTADGGSGLVDFQVYICF